jgi:hypothetical protein
VAPQKKRHSSANNNNKLCCRIPANFPPTADWVPRRTSRQNQFPTVQSGICLYTW